MLQRRFTAQKLAPGALVLLAMQHVLVMYSGAIAPPLIIAAALKLPKATAAYLISADLLAGGLATLVQTVGCRGVGIRLPIMMGVAFSAIGPMIAIGANPDLGLAGIYGATIAAGVFGFLVAPIAGRLLPLFPPVVTGAEILAVGLSLMGVAATWAGGGAGAQDFGNPVYLAIAGTVLVFVIAIVKFGRGLVANIAVLLGLVAGFGLALTLGQVSLAGLSEAPWLGVVTPFHFGLPKFNLWAILAMCVVMVVTFIESTGMFLAIGEITEEVVTQRALVSGFRADGIGNILGGIFNAFPYTSFAQNVGLVAITGVRSRWVCAAGGVILILLGLLPKLSILVASIPQCVLGGVGLVMFGMVVANGIRTLAKANLHDNRNLYVVAISVGMGMLPVVSDKLFAKLPSFLTPVLGSSVLLTAATAVVLNVVLNGVAPARELLPAALGSARERI